MGSDSQSSALTDRDLSDIQLLFEIARVNGARLSVSEAISLLLPEVSKEDIDSALNHRSDLNEPLLLHAGLLISRDEAQEGTAEMEVVDRQRRIWAERNLAFAYEFAAYCGVDSARVFSVSGSSSYGSVSAGDDLDFFCIAPSGTLWLFITRLLIFARVFRAFNRGSPSLCLSCMMDEDFAKRTFKMTRDGLFARDALSVSIIHGHGFYGRLLGENSWLSEYFPKLYHQRLSANGLHPVTILRKEPNGLLMFANNFVYHFVGNYLRLKAYLGNRRLTRDRRGKLLFTAKIGPDYCIYESVRYSELRQLYSRFGKRGETETFAIHS